MSRILFILFNGSGRILPAIGVIRALRSDGHSVGVVTLPAEYRPAEQLANQLAAMGADLIPSPPAPAEIHPAALYPGTQAEEVAASFMMDGPTFASFRRQRQIMPVRPQIDPLRKIIASYQPHLVVADTLAYQSGIAAHLEGRRWVGYSASHRLVAPAGIEYEPEAHTIVPEAKSIFAEFGMTPQFASLEYLSPFLNIVFALPELIGDERPNKALVRMVGPPSRAPRGDEVPFDWSQLATDRPLVYVSFGSVLRWQPHELDLLTEATATLGVQCVISAGDVAETKSFPPHVLVVPYAPQIELLRRVEVFVTVGGANSVNEALCSGVPMLVVPILSDQPLMGHLVHRAKVGICVPRDQHSVPVFREALTRLLDDTQGFRVRMKPVRRAYEQTDGVRNAANVIASVCR